MTFAEFKAQHKGVYIKLSYGSRVRSLYGCCDDMEVVEWKQPLGGAYIVYLKEVREEKKSETQN